MKVGDTFVYESILCTKFKGEIFEEAEVGGYKAIDSSSNRFCLCHWIQLIFS